MHFCRHTDALGEFLYLFLVLDFFHPQGDLILRRLKSYMDTCPLQSAVQDLTQGSFDSLTAFINGSLPLNVRSVGHPSFNNTLIILPPSLYYSDHFVPKFKLQKGMK